MAINFDCRKTLPRLLREPGFTLDSNGYRQTSSELLREPDSANNSDLKLTPPGLLREPGSIPDFNRKKDPTRAPTGAGLRP